MLVVAGCHTPNRFAKDASASKDAAPVFMNLQDSSDLRLKDFFKGAPATQFGDDLQVWYKDFGDTVEIVTASEPRVLMHVNTIESRQSGGRSDVVYSALDSGSVCSQYARN